MKNRIKKIERKIKVLEREKEECDEKLSKLLYPFGIFRILKKNVREESLQLRKLACLTKIEIEDLYEKLNEMKK